MSLLAGALFGVIRGLLLVVFNATAGASSCFFLSKLIGRPLVSWLWPEKLRFFQAEVCLLFFCLFSVNLSYFKIIIYLTLFLYHAYCINLNFRGIRSLSAEISC